MEIHEALQPLDFIVIVVYIVALLGLGAWVSIRNKDAQQDLFLGGRTLPWYNVGLSIFGTNIGPSFLIASCSIAYTSGVVGANFEWLAWWFLMLLGMLFIPHYMRTRVDTMPQFMLRRFGPRVYGFLSWYALFTTVILWLGGALYAGGVLFSQIMAWPLWLSVVFLASISLLLTTIGGLIAVVVTDSFQSILMIAGSATLTIIAFTKVGSLSALLDATPPDYWQLFRAADDEVYPWHAVLLGYPVLAIWFWCTDQTIVQRALGARDLRQAQVGVAFAGFLKIIPPFIFMLPGILCFVLHPDLSNPDEAFMTMVTHYLPVGMTGLIVAVLIAALVSTVDSGLNSFSTIFTLDIYARKYRPNASAAEIKWVGRIAMVGVAILAVLCALSMEGVGKNMFTLLQGIISFIAPPMGAVFLIGVLWKRATSSAALATLVLGSAVSLSIGLMHFKHWPTAGFWPNHMLLAFYLFAGICAFMVLTSLATRNDKREEKMPTLGETYRDLDQKPGLVWGLWAVLAAIMLAIYAVLN
ncbi:MAG: sodium/solute symporter [Candidatus Latescibacterota bacterium]|nr:sodium/solute symporter [Candidatus Latescibacterota bacterium]